MMMLHNNHLKRYTLQFSMIIIHIHAQLYKTQHYKKRSSYFQLFNIHVFNKISPQQDLLPSSEVGKGNYQALVILYCMVALKN